MAKIKSYEAAMSELEELVDQIQSEAIGVDDLSKKIQRAGELIEYCKLKLRDVRSEIENIGNAG